ncbi:AHNK protein, partial [Sapayoa aenigma]|nr:AHNK protein [Sapayoa aenigma]
GDQIVSATVYFDNLQSGEVAQLLQTMGHHTVGLRLQRRGDRSPLPGQPWGHDVFGAGSPEVVLSGDDEEYRRIYATKIKPRLRSEEGADAEGGGTQSRTITVTRKVTAYTVDVTRNDGAGDLDVVGPDFDVRGADGEPGRSRFQTGEAAAGGRPGTRPESQIPAGETGKAVAAEAPGWKGSGAFPGSPRVETNGQMGDTETGFRVRVDGKGHALCLQGGVRAPGADGSSPPADVGKIKIPALKIPKFGFQAGGEAPAPQVGAEVGVTCPPARVDVGLKGAVTTPSPQLGVDIEAPDVDIHGPEGKFKMPKFKMPKFGMKGEAPEVDVTLPKGDVDVSLPKVDVEVPSLDVKGLEGKVKVPEVHVKAPKVSMPDVDLSLNGAKVSGDLDVSGLKGPELELKGPKVDVETPDLDIQGPEGKLKFPKLKMPKFGVKGESPDVDVTLPKGKVDVSCPGVDIDVPSVDIQGPEGKLKGPKVKVPEMSIKTPQISVPDVDLNLRGPKVKGDLDVSAPKLEGELKAPGLDIKGPKVEVEVPDLDIQGPEGKLKFPKLKMPKFGVKGESPSVDVALPKGEVDISGPK